MKQTSKLLLLVLLLTSSCVVIHTMWPKRSVNDLISQAKTTSLPEFTGPQIHGPTSTEELKAAILDEAPKIPGFIRMLKSPTECQMDGSVPPFVYINTVWPSVGKLIDITWVNRVCTVPELPTEPALLLMSLRHRPEPIDLTSYNAPGCWLMVHNDFVLYPSYDIRAPLCQYGGYVRLKWVPPMGMAGLHLWIQTVYLTTTNPSGHIVTPAVELLIGNVK